MGSTSRIRKTFWRSPQSRAHAEEFWGEHICKQHRFVYVLSWFLFPVSLEGKLIRSRFRRACSADSPAPLRQVGPGTLSCRTARFTPDALSSSNKMQRDYMGLKITLCMRSWGKFWTKRYKDKKNIYCHFRRAGSKNLGVREQKSPCTKHHIGVGRPPKPPLQQDPCTHPPPHPV